MYKKILLFLCFFSMMFMLAGCYKRSEYIDIYYCEINDFYDFIDEKDKELYIREGKLDCAKIEETVIIPFIRTISYDECNLLLYVYSFNKNAIITIDRVLLTTEDGNILCNVIPSEPNVELSFATETMLYSSMIADTLQLEETWFHDDNQLLVTISATISDGENVTQKDVSFNIKLFANKTLVFPT